MNPYASLASGIGTPDASELATRLAAWHDAMVAHERRLRAHTTESCDDECPHVEARALWSAALATFGPRAKELIFLRSRGLASTRASHPVAIAPVPASQRSRRGAFVTAPAGTQAGEL
jgi:hypothetical protein